LLFESRPAAKSELGKTNLGLGVELLPNCMKQFKSNEGASVVGVAQF